MESLQFQKAEYANPGRKCAVCGSAIENSYFQLSGQMVCPACGEKLQAKLTRPTNAVVLRGFLFGAGAAVGCSICYAIITAVTGLELAIAAIAVGYLVGRAVRFGTNGLGDRRCQIIAVVLTYLSITSAYIPLMIKGEREPAKEISAAKSGSEKSREAPSQQSQDLRTTGDAPTLGQFAAGGMVLIGMAMALPFFGLAEGVGGILGLAIIAFGLMQAWKQTARHPLVLTGPFTLDQNSSAT